MRSGAVAVADPSSLKIERAREIWTAGDFGRIATGYLPGAATFITRLCITDRERVLDIGSGTGNLTLLAARAGAIATGVDIAPNLIAQAEANAELEGLVARFDEGSADELPYADESFDTVVSMFGVMFAARPVRAATEMLRVLTQGGRLAIASWTPGGFVGQVVRLVESYVAQPAVSPSVLEWGDESVVRQRLAGAARLECVRRRITFEYPCSPASTVRLFRDWHGPTACAFAALDDARRALLERDLVALWSDNNRACGALTRVESEYLEVVAGK